VSLSKEFIGAADATVTYNDLGGNVCGYKIGTPDEVVAACQVTTVGLAPQVPSPP
jgi:hypothetical protein